MLTFNRCKDHPLLAITYTEAAAAVQAVPVEAALGSILAALPGAVYSVRHHLHPSVAARRAGI